MIAVTRAALARTPEPLVLATLLVLGGAAVGQQPGPRQTPPPAVVVERIEVREVSEPSEFTARVEAIGAVDIRARVQGFLRTVAFQAGQTVEAGDLLFEIEPDQYQALVASAEAQLSRAEAAREAAERTLARTEELLERQAAAQATLDEAQAAFDIARADAEVAEAALRTAELDQSYTRITAPIAGQIGRAAFTEGNLVGPESGTLARIVQLDPIRIVFSISEGLLVSLRQEASTGQGIDPDALRLTLRLPNDTEYQPAGQIEYVESEVDPQTGTVAVRAVFPNPDRILIPNQFVTLLLREEEVPSLPVVPQTAVLQDRQGRFVYVLGEDNTVSQRRIETGAGGERLGGERGPERGRAGRRAGHPAPERRDHRAAERGPAGGVRLVISNLFISRPKLAMVVSIVISLAGALALLVLPVQQYPEITPPTVSVSASYPGASAEVIADVVGGPLETAINGVDDMMYMSSTSSNAGQYSLAVTFEVGTDPDIAQVNVQNRAKLAIAQLPAEVAQQGVSVRTRSPDFLLALGFYSPEGSLSTLEITNLVSTGVVDTISRVEGVGEASVIGAAEYSMRVWTNPTRMAALGITPDDVAAAIRAQNIQASLGQVGAQPAPAGTAVQYTLVAQGRLETPRRSATSSCARATRAPSCACGTSPASSSAPRAMRPTRCSTGATPR